MSLRQSCTFWLPSMSSERRYRHGPPSHTIPHPLLTAQVQQASITRFAYQHRLYSQFQVEQTSLTNPLHHRCPHFVLNCSAVCTFLLCSSGALWRPGKWHRHVARMSRDRRVTTRTFAKILQRRVGLPQSTHPTPREAQHHSSRSGIGQWHRILLLSHA